MVQAAVSGFLDRRFTTSLFTRTVWLKSLPKVPVIYRAKYCHRQAFCVVLHKFEYIKTHKIFERKHLAVRIWRTTLAVRSLFSFEESHRIPFKHTFANCICRLLTVNWPLFQPIKRLIERLLAIAFEWLYFGLESY